MIELVPSIFSVFNINLVWVNQRFDTHADSPCP
jgi:hypothetical protein